MDLGTWCAHYYQHITTPSASLSRELGNIWMDTYNKHIHLHLCLLFFKEDWFLKNISFFKRFFLFLEKGEGGRKRRRETPMCGCLLSTPHWGPGLQPRHVPWLGIKPATLWFVDQRSITEPHRPGVRLCLFLYLSTCIKNHESTTLLPIPVQLIEFTLVFPLSKWLFLPPTCVILIVFTYLINCWMYVVSHLHCHPLPKVVSLLIVLTLRLPLQITPLPGHHPLCAWVLKGLLRASLLSSQRLQLSVLGRLTWTSFSLSSGPDSWWAMSHMDSALSVQAQTSNTLFPSLWAPVSPCINMPHRTVPE